MRDFAWIIAAPLALGIAGCARPARSVGDPDPSDKIPAIKDAVARHDRRAVPLLVDDLSSDDPAVRFYAIDALRQLTKNDFGYRYYVDAEAREPAIKAWRQWLAAQPAK